MRLRQKEGTMRSRFTVVRLTRLALGALLILGAVSTPAVAQTIGARAGVSIEPEQFYFGGHAETPPVVDRLRFRPNIEIGLGSDTTVAAFNVEVAYHFRSAEPWSVYAGGGPALNIIKIARDTDAEPGFNVLVGMAHEDGLFAELKVGALDSPRLKFGVGYAIRWR
jgi:hypothetical protein